MLARTIGNKINLFKSPAGIFPYVGKEVVRVLAIALGHQQRLFECNCRHISLHIYGSLRRASCIFRKQNYVVSSPTVGVYPYVAKAVESLLAVAYRKKTKLVRVPLSIYFLMEIRQLNAS